jgi:trk system potassium uptake protein TrkH
MTWLLAVCPVLGIIAMAMSASHLLPIAISLVTRDGMAALFTISMVLNLAVGGSLWLLMRDRRRELRIREGILLITLV